MHRRQLLLPGLAVAALLTVLVLRTPEHAHLPRPLAAVPAVEASTSASELHAPDLIPPSDASSSHRTSHEATAPTTREPASPETSTHLHGFVIDAHTGTALVAPFELGVVFSTGGKPPFLGSLLLKHGTRLGAAGTFEVSTKQPERITARVVEWTTGTELVRTAHRYSDGRLSDGRWRLPLEVGWMAQLELSDGAPPELASVQLIEVVDGEERRWPSPTLLGSDRTLVLFRETAFEPDPAHRRWLVVTARAADSLGEPRLEARIDVPVVNGIQPAPIRIELRAKTFARGRVLDEHGEPWSEAVVELRPLFEAGVPTEADDLWQGTQDDGTFEFNDLVPGEYGARASALFTAWPRERRWIRAGENDLGSLLLPRLGARGVVSGELVAVGDGPDTEGPVAILTLRDRNARAEIVGMVFEFDLFNGPSGRTSFELKDVPVGPYELDILALDGRGYPSTPLRIEAPVSGLVIEATASPHSPCELELRDARSREVLEPTAVLHLVAGRWLPADDELKSLAGEPCIVLAERHRPLRLDSPGELLRHARGSRQLELELEPGWGRAVFFRDLSAAPPAAADDAAAFFGPPLIGVRVLADGRELARSDATGFAVLALDSAPAHTAFELAGYRVLSSDTDDGMQLVVMARE